MKRIVLVVIFVALFAGIFAIAATWSRITPVPPPVTPDTTATPNPAPQQR